MQMLVQIIQMHVHIIQMHVHIMQMYMHIMQILQKLILRSLIIILIKVNISKMFKYNVKKIEGRKLPE